MSKFLNMTLFEELWNADIFLRFMFSLDLNWMLTVYGYNTQSRYMYIQYYVYAAISHIRLIYLR